MLACAKAPNIRQVAHIAVARWPTLPIISAEQPADDFMLFIGDGREDIRKLAVGPLRALLKEIS
jgi:hypothetical protein